jgi:hypothetical protein
MDGRVGPPPGVNNPRAMDAAFRSQKRATLEVRGVSRGEMSHQLSWSCSRVPGSKPWRACGEVFGSGAALCRSACWLRTGLTSAALPDPLCHPRPGAAVRARDATLLERKLSEPARLARHASRSASERGPRACRVLGRLARRASTVQPCSSVMCLRESDVPCALKARLTTNTVKDTTMSNAPLRLRRRSELARESLMPPSQRFVQRLCARSFSRRVASVSSRLHKKPAGRDRPFRPASERTPLGG